MNAKFHQCPVCLGWYEKEFEFLMCNACKTKPNKNIICGECGKPMILRTSDKFLKDGKSGYFWGCSNFPICRGTHSAHKDGRPMGIPADKSTKKARIEAHEIFDSLWKEGRMKRKEAYQIICELMNLSEEEAHIGRFTKEQCMKLIYLISTHYPLL